ncbi:MAG: Sec-independent protein translocase protein TatB [Alphaproteobacteria bacterium]
MFDIGWSELAVVAVVALIVIGPKDLPRVLRTVGQWISRARAVARDFQSSIDEMAREADLQDVKKQIQDLQSANVADLIEKHVDPKGELKEAFTPPDELSTLEADMNKALAGSPPSEPPALTAEETPGATPPPVEPTTPEPPPAAPERAAGEPAKTGTGPG